MVEVRLRRSTTAGREGISRRLTPSQNAHEVRRMSSRMEDRMERLDSYIGHHKPADYNHPGYKD